MCLANVAWDARLATARRSPTMWADLVHMDSFYIDIVEQDQCLAIEAHVGVPKTMRSAQHRQRFLPLLGLD